VKSLIEKISKTKDGPEYEADEDKRGSNHEGSCVFTASSAAALLDDNREGIEREDLRIPRLQMALVLAHSDVAHTLPRGKLGSERSCASRIICNDGQIHFGLVRDYGGVQNCLPR